MLGYGFVLPLPLRLVSRRHSSPAAADKGRQPQRRANHPEPTICVESRHPTEVCAMLRANVYIGGICNKTLDRESIQ